MGIDIVVLRIVMSCEHRYINHFYWPTNALNFIILNRLKYVRINILKDN